MKSPAAQWVDARLRRPGRAPLPAGVPMAQLGTTLYHAARLPRPVALLPFTRRAPVIIVTIREGVAAAPPNDGGGAKCPRYVIMEIMKSCADYGDAPSFVATGIRRIFFVSPNIVRITFVRTDRRHDGVEEQRVSGHVDCDVSQLDSMNKVIAQVVERLVAEDTPVMGRRHLVRSPAAH